MTSIWVESLGRTFDQALDLLAAAVRDCTDELWESSMWEVPADVFGPAPPGPDGKPVTDPAARNALAQRRSTPWSVAWHALEVLDYDLTGEFGSWAPPPPFAGNPHWLLTRLPAPWTRSEMLGYLDYCRKRVRDTLAGMTDEQATTPRQCDLVVLALRRVRCQPGHREEVLGSYLCAAPCRGPADAACVGTSPIGVPAYSAAPGAGG